MSNRFKKSYLYIVALLSFCYIFFSFNLIFNPNKTTNPIKEGVINSLFNEKTNSTSSNNLLSEFKYKIKANLRANQETDLLHFEIDKGEDDGVEVGNAVTNQNGQLLGIIDSKTSKNSKVQLLTSPDFKIPVWIKNENNKGLLKGLYGYSAEINWISDGKDIENVPIFTSNLNNKSKSGLLVGYSYNTRIGKSGSFYTANINKIAKIPNISDNVLVW